MTQSDTRHHTVNRDGEGAGPGIPIVNSLSYQDPSDCLCQGMNDFRRAPFFQFLFSITVVSLPLLLDREPGFISAMITSVRTVIKSPLVILSRGVFVTLSVMVSFVLFFLGLLFVLPILVHTTWHISLKAVAPVG